MFRGRPYAVTLGVMASLLAGPGVRGDVAPDLVSPPPVAGNVPEREHAVDVADYTLRARLDAAAHTVHGEGTIRFKNTSSAPVTSLWLHLYLNAFKNERSTFLQESSAGSRGSLPLTDWGTIDLRRLSLRAKGMTDPTEGTDLLPGLSEARARHDSEDETDAEVHLPQALAPGDSLSLDVVWDDKLPNVVERTGYAGSFHFVGQWFPKLARLEPDGTWAHFPFHHLAEFYADFGTYDVTLDVPDSFVTGATGPVVEARHEAGRLIERHVQADVHDFAWTAWDKFRAREESVHGITVRILYPPGFERDAERELATVRFALPYFENLYGSYPYSVLTLVHPPEAATESGGMEYPTLITTGGAWYGAPFTRLLELVTVHELGHQYFYGLVASNEQRSPFLDEGINSYVEADVLRAMFGSGSAVAGLGLTVSDESVQAVFGNEAEHDAPVASSADAFPTGSLYSALVYERTGAILETLRRVYGDAPMRHALGSYARVFRFEHPGPADFIRSIETALGNEAARLLRCALFEKGWVDFAVTEVVSHPDNPPRGIFDRNGARETVKDGPVPSPNASGWVLIERRGTLSIPVEVLLTRADGTSERVSWDGQAESVRLLYRGSSPLVAAMVDPEHRVLLDDNLANNFGTTVDAKSSGAFRTLERAIYWSQLLLESVAP